MKKIFIFVFAVLCFSAVSYAQPRTPVKSDPAPTPTPAAAPTSFAAKYEGGVFGYQKKEQGTLKFEDANERLVFFGQDGKEKFQLPYKALLAIYPHSKSVQTTAGKVVGAIPVLGANILGGFIKEKRRYLVVNFSDPDVDAKGTTSFKLETKELLDSVVTTLAQKAKLKPRGDAYLRPISTDKTDDSN